MHKEPHNIGDTLLTNDVVVNHYESLPYPPFTRHDFNTEQKYYTRKTDQKPFHGVHTITLDNLNHFLFRGNQSFR